MIKGICKSHKEFIANTIPWYHQFLDASETIFYPTSLYWISGIWSILFSALYGSKRVITTQKLTGEFFMDLVEKFKVTHVFFQPHILAMIVKSKNYRQMEKVRSVRTGGTRITAEFIEDTKILFPNAKIGTVYGCTEAGMVALTRKSHKSWSSGPVMDRCQIKVRRFIFEPCFVVSWFILIFLDCRRKRQQPGSEWARRDLL